MYDRIARLLAESDSRRKLEMIEEICAILIAELREEGLSSASSDFLLDHAHSVHERIQDDALRARFSVVA
jgi:hypothetical protein